MRKNENKTLFERRSDTKRKQLQKRESETSDSQTLVRHIFLAHGLSQVGLKSFGIICASVLSLLCDVLGVYYTVYAMWDILALEEISIKRKSSGICTYLCALLLRIWFHAKGTKLIDAIDYVREMCKETTSIGIWEKLEKIVKKKCITIFILHAAYFAILTFVCVYNSNRLRQAYYSRTHTFQNKTGVLNFATVPLYINDIWFVMALPSIFVIYFYVLCSLFQRSVDQLTKDLKTGFQTNIKQVLLSYSVITDTFNDLNDALHTPLVLICIHILFNAFYFIFMAVFDENKVPEEVLQYASTTLVHFLNFNLMCISSSGISNSYEVMRNEVHHILMKDAESRNLSITLRLLEDEPLTLLLLDSIPLDKSLVVKAFGTMITYGILIANLGKKTNYVQSHRNCFGNST